MTIDMTWAGSRQFTRWSRWSAWMAHMNHRTTWCALAVSGVFALGACTVSVGKSPTSTAEELIASALGEQAGMILTGADCETPVDDEVGTPFDCTATNSDGAVITFVAVIDPDEMVFVAPSNLVYGEEMSVVEAEAAETLGPEVGVVIDPADVDCPDETTALDDESQLRCEISDAATGDRYELTVAFGDFVLREGYCDRSYQIGDQPL